MAYRLPEQEEKEGTYLESLPYMEALIKNRLVKGKPEGETSRVWDDILHLCFPGGQNFSVGPEMTLGGGKADLFAAHFVLEPRLLEKKFLIVECKAPGLESRDDIWLEAAGQLRIYLGGVRGTHRKFGAIAVGKCVRFYEWIDSDLQDIANGDIYWIDRQCKTVTEHLNYFRENC
ncbi:hypothetical protein F4774DRAFT_398138 [Daldinia eschscholtzii]|nr:hypothetical protein F4774DRAFT_398138 [Daldinia eschscholtzii]